MKSVKKNRCTLVESWCHPSSGGTEQLRVTKLRIRDEYDHKTAIVTENGHYEWVVCPFGLSSTPSCFQRLMSTVLEEHIHVSPETQVRRGRRSRTLFYRTIVLSGLVWWTSTPIPLRTCGRYRRGCRHRHPKTSYMLIIKNIQSRC